MVQTVIIAEGLDELRKQLDPKSIDLAIASTINKTATKLRTATSRDIREVYNVKARAVRETLSIKRATSRNQEALLVSTGPRISLKEFGARQTRRGVSVRVRKAGGRKTVKSTFLVESIGGHVFRRKGKKRLPIERLFGPAIPQMMSSPDVLKKLIEQANQDAPRIFENELRFRVLKKTGQL